MKRCGHELVTCEREGKARPWARDATVWRHHCLGASMVPHSCTTLQRGGGLFVSSLVIFLWTSIFFWLKNVEGNRRRLEGNRRRLEADRRRLARNHLGIWATSKNSWCHSRHQNEPNWGCRDQAPRKVQRPPSDWQQPSTQLWTPWPPSSTGIANREG